MIIYEDLTWCKWNEDLLRWMKMRMIINIRFMETSLAFEDLDTINLVENLNLRLYKGKMTNIENGFKRHNIMRNLWWKSSLNTFRVNTALHKSGNSTITHYFTFVLISILFLRIRLWTVIFASQNYFDYEKIQTSDTCIDAIMP